MKQHITAIVVLTLTATALTACARVPEEAEKRNDPIAVVLPQPASRVSTSDAEQIPASPMLAQMVVHKSASCGCCGIWVDHMRKAGFAVEVRNSDDLNPIKELLGIPLGKGSCHTAEVGGYFIEGHIPEEDVKRLLAQKLDARGLVLAGMPAGSPGMEMPDGRTQAYTVELVSHDGTITAFAQHGQ